MFTRCRFAGNSSDGNGGAIYEAHREAEGPLLFRDCWFSNNYATVSAGAVYGGSCSNCTFFGNSCGTGNSGKWNITGTGDLTTNLNDAVNIPANAFSGFTATINAGVGLAVVVNNKVLGAGSINGATKVFTLSDDFTLKRRRSFAHQRHAHHQRLRDSKSLLPRHGLNQRRDQRHNRRQGRQ